MITKKILQRYIIPSFIIVFFTCMVVISFVVPIFKSKVEKGRLIIQDIAQLKTIFEKIDNSCRIIDFDLQQNPINFLTIKKGGFVGSEIGSMNIALPKKWDGPYLQDNPTMDGKEYLVVRTKKGYFITPGNGVVLPNGKMIGKDIILDEDSNIGCMMFEESALSYKKMPMAAHILIRGPRASVRLPAGY